MTIIVDDPAGTIMPEERARYREIFRERAGYDGPVIFVTNKVVDDEADLHNVPYGIWPAIEAEQQRAVLVRLDAPSLREPDLYENRAARRAASRQSRRAAARPCHRVKGLR